MIAKFRSDLLPRNFDVK